MRIPITPIAVLALALTMPAVAQLTPARPLDPTGKPSLPTPKLPSVVVPVVTKRLTITYYYAGQRPMEVHVAGAQLTCTPPPSRTATRATCTADALQGSTVTITGTRYEPNGLAEPLKTAMWGGDCAGTVGPSCRLTMSGDHGVLIGL